MTHVLVAVPARDEAARIGRCLTSVLVAVRAARAAGAVDRVTVGVAAHRCADATATIATDLLRDTGDLVLTDSTSATVGAVRARLVSALRRQAGHRPSSQVWLFHTDADSVVPPDWITGTLARVREQRAAAAAGMVALHDWHASPEAQRRYAAIIDRGISADGHRHVYGANLAVRLDAHDEVGGFRDAGPGEDQDLVDRLRAHGLPVASLFAPLVVTSARAPGRAAGGLGALLADLLADRSPLPAG